MVRIFEKLYPMDMVEKEVHQYPLWISREREREKKERFSSHVNHRHLQFVKMFLTCQRGR